MTRRAPLAVLTIAALASSPVVAWAKMINLPGTIAGGVEICTSITRQCVTTPPDRESPVRVISYRDGEGEGVIMYGGQRYVALANQVVVNFKGCRVSLGSFVQGSLCPGVHR